MKYGIQRGGWWCSEEIIRPYGVGLFRNGWENFSNYVSFKVGNGSYICFATMFGADNWFSKLHSQNFILYIVTKRLSVGLLVLIWYLHSLEFHQGSPGLELELLVSSSTYETPQKPIRGCWIALCRP